MSHAIVIKKNNPLRKAEIPVIGIISFYFFIFYAMSAGDLRIMFSRLFSIEDGILGITIAVIGFGCSICLNFLQVSHIALTSTQLIASSRVGIKRKYDLQDLERCRIRWYNNKAGRVPIIQFDFSNGSEVQVPGHHYKGLKLFILHLREVFGEKLREIG